jgi:hypothetical protein
MSGDDIDGIGVQMRTPCRVDMPSVYYREPDGRVGAQAFTGYRELYQESVERGAAEQIWMTEFGISSQTSTCAEGPGANLRPAGVTKEQQAQFLSEAYACMAADAYMGPAFWYSLQDTGQTPSRYDHFMGLFGNDMLAKPAAHAFFALKSGITPNPACGGRVDTASPTVTIEAAPTFTDRLPIKVSATDAETPVGRMYLTVRKASDPPESQTQIPGGGQGGSYSLDWDGAKSLPVGVPHIITGYAYDEAKNLGAASVTVERVAPAGPGTTAPVVVKLATSSTIDVQSKKGRRAIVSGTLTYTVPTGLALGGRGRVLVEYFQKGKGRQKSKWVTTSRFTILSSALRRARVIDRATGKRRRSSRRPPASPARRSSGARSSSSTGSSPTRTRARWPSSGRRASRPAPRSRARADCARARPPRPPGRPCPGPASRGRTAGRRSAARSGRPRSRPRRARPCRCSRGGRGSSRPASASR